jgi:hypothetical protein
MGGIELAGAAVTLLIHSDSILQGHNRVRTYSLRIFVGFSHHVNCTTLMSDISYLSFKVFIYTVSVRRLLPFRFALKLAFRHSRPGLGQKPK